MKLPLETEVHPAPRKGKMEVAKPPATQGGAEIQLKTILNRVQRHKGFVYESCKLKGKKSVVLEVTVRADVRVRPICSGCQQPGPGYDTLAQRRFEFVPLWAIAVFFLYAMRRVDCRKCGVTVEAVPWAEGKSHLTKAYMGFLASWAKRMSWKELLFRQA